MSTNTARPTPPWAIVTLREVMVKARDRSYLISTLVTLVLIVGVVVFNAFMSSRAEEYTVAVTDAAGTAVVDIAHTTGQDDGGNTSFEAVAADSADGALELVRSGDADAALTQETDGSWTLTGNEELSSGLQQGLAEALRAFALEANAADAGTTAEALLEGSEFDTALLDGNAENQFMAQFAGFVFAFLFYMAAIVFGMAIATSVQIGRASCRERVF